MLIVDRLDGAFSRREPTAGGRATFARMKGPGRRDAARARRRARSSGGARADLAAPPPRRPSSSSLCLRAPTGASRAVRRPACRGVLTAFVPFVVGCGLWSSNDGKLENVGTYVMAAGFAAAPWVSHGLQRRWKRAAVFGGVSVATSAATLIAMEAKDPFYAPYANHQRVAFGVFLTSAMFAAALGVFDSFLTAPARQAP